MYIVCDAAREARLWGVPFGRMVDPRKILYHVIYVTSYHIMLYYIILVYYVVTYYLHFGNYIYVSEC
jgi:hypothetical protein